MLLYQGGKMSHAVMPPRTTTSKDKPVLILISETMK